MRFHGLDLNLLAAFQALFIERHLGRAGQRVHLSQPAMSSALARLRAYFDDELFVQAGRKLVPTPLAENLALAVTDILAQVEARIVATPEFDPATTQRRFSLLVSEYSMAVLMPSLLPRLRKEAPGIALDLLPLSRANPDAMLEANEADLLLVPTRYLSAEHPQQTIFAETYTCVAWSGNTSLEAGLDFDRYMAAGHVVVQTAPQRAAAFEGWFLAQYGVSRRTVVTTASLTAPPLLVVGTDLLATVHTRLAKQCLAQGLPLRLLAPPLDIPPLAFAMQWHKHKDRDPGLTWLRQAVQDVAATL